MIILTKENFENNEQITNIIEKEKKLITSAIESQKNLKNMLLDYMKKLADYTDDIDTDYLEIVLNLLESFKNTLSLFNINQDLLSDLLKSLNNIVVAFCNNDINSESINNFNISFFEKNEIISRNTIQIENVLYSALHFSKFIFCKTNDDSIYNTIFLDKAEEDKTKEDKNSEIPASEDLMQSSNTYELPVDKNVVQPTDTTNIVENTLIISETKGKVLLPYTTSLLNDILKKNPDKYSCIEDIIQKDYTLPFNLFKNPAIARFREAFNLIRKKEKKSIGDAFDLGMELLFNYNLHPAIISACKDLDELDFYLECLENNELDKFDCFKIIFDIAPVSKKDI